MATIGNSFRGLIDHYTSTDRNGNIVPVAETLHTLNPLMQDAYITEANEGSQHLSTIRTGLGEVAWGQLYKGIIQSKGTTTQVRDTTGFVERLSTIDTRYLDRVKNPAGERMMEANAALEAISQDVQSNFFYSDTTTTPERFKGVASRYNAIINGGAAATQIVDAGGTGADNTSIYGIGWGESGTGLIYPEGSTGGIVRQEKGEQRTNDELGRPYYVKEEYFAQHVGVFVRDWRYNFRIANIDVSDALAGNVDLFRHLRAAYYRLQERRNTRVQNGGMASGVKPVIYMNRDMMQVLDGLSTNSGAADNRVRLVPDDVAGKEVLTYRGIPIRETDALINAEARVQ